MLVELAQRFGRAASQYDQYAQLQWQAASQCAAMLDPSHTRVADIGIGTGFVARQLTNAEIIGVDISQPMLQQARTQSQCMPVQADMQALPFANASFDAVVSSLAMQWALDAAECLSEWRRVVKPGGSVVFATLLHGSLQPLHHCRAAMGLTNNQFLTAAELENALQQSGWRVKNSIQQQYNFYYSDVWQLAKSLKYIGAQMRTERSSPLATRRHWQTLAAHYESFRHMQGLPLPYELIYVLAEK